MITKLETLILTFDVNIKLYDILPIQFEKNNLIFNIDFIIFSELYNIDNIIIKNISNIKFTKNLLNLLNTNLDKIEYECIDNLLTDIESDIINQIYGAKYKIKYFNHNKICVLLMIINKITEKIIYTNDNNEDNNDDVNDDIKSSGTDYDTFFEDLQSHDLKDMIIKLRSDNHELNNENDILKNEIIKLQNEITKLKK
jgi:polyhydroxyalkanoate synthesis regulator phasin